MSKLFCIVHNESGKEIIYKGDYHRENMLKQTSKETGINIPQDSHGHVKIYPLKNN